MIEVDQWPGYYASVNRLCRELPGASIVVTGGDDVYPEPHCAPKRLAAEFYERFPDGFGVMQPDGDDLYGAKFICSSPWFGRAWIREAYMGNGPMCSIYSVWFGDQELALVARGLGALWRRPDLTQRHEHWWRTGKRMDYQIRNEQMYWNSDKMLFETRQINGFPGHERLRT